MFAEHRKVMGLGAACLAVDSVAGSEDRGDQPRRTARREGEAPWNATRSGCPWVHSMISSPGEASLVETVTCPICAVESASYPLRRQSPLGRTEPMAIFGMGTQRIGQGTGMVDGDGTAPRQAIRVA